MTPETSRPRGETGGGESGNGTARSIPDADRYGETLLEAALGAAAAGLRVHPVWGVRELPDGTRACQCSDSARCPTGHPGKHPILSGWPEAATTAPAFVHLWFGRGKKYRTCNLGIVTGKDSGCWALDVDGPEGAATLEALEDEHGKLPATLTQRTGGGGEHRLFKHPGWKVATKARIAPGIDIRGDGGQIVAEPSRHITGGTYSWIDGDPGEVEIVEAPEWLLAMVRKASGGEQGGRRRRRGGLDEGIPQGERNNRLFRLGCSLRAKGMGEVEITAALEAANGRCKPPLEADELAVIVGSVLQYDQGGSRPAGRARPKVDASEKDLAVQTEETWKAVVATNTPPTLFRRGGMIVRVERDDEDRVGARGARLEHVRHYAASHIEFFSWRKTEDGFEEVPARPPRDLIENLIATPEPPLPILSRVVAAPTFARDGHLIEEEGYHPSSGMYLDLGDLEVPPVPERPSRGELAAARDLLLVEVLGDFPFVGPADRAGALALLLGPFARALIRGPTPLHLVEKPTPGTGAGLMMDCVATIATGGPAEVATEAREDEEWRKKITSLLLAAPPLVLIDNVRGRLDSGPLSAALTGETWTDRRLGGNVMVSLPVTCIWAATANNPATSSEIARRTVPIRLDAKVDRPWKRGAGEFRHPSLKAWVAENRGRLVHAALTLIRGWLAAGRPRETSCTLGSYERWAETMGGILRVAEVPGFLDNLPEFYDRADREGEAHRALVAAWWTRFADAAVGSAQLYPLVAEEEISIDLGSGNDKAQRTKFGNELRKLRDRRFGDLKVEALDAKKHGARYRLIQDVRRERKGEPREPGERFPPACGNDSDAHTHDVGPGAKGSRGSRGSPGSPATPPDDEEARERLAIEEEARDAARRAGRRE